jgi:hypothetical protein
MFIVRKNIHQPNFVGITYDIIRVADSQSILNYFMEKYSRNCLLKSDKTVYLVESASGKNFRSPIFTSSKSEESRFIYSGWKKFIKENKLCYKDRVVFNSKKGNNVLEVQVIRRTNPV